MKKMITILIVALTLFGCGVKNVIKRGEYIDNKSITAGTPRAVVLARFGSPIDRKEDGDCVIELYRVPQGETTTGKALKAGGILLVDIFTLGLSEVVATPVTDSKGFVVFKVMYGKDDLVREYQILAQ